jgi:hypothetical protein
VLGWECRSGTAVIRVRDEHVTRRVNRNAKGPEQACLGGGTAVAAVPLSPASRHDSGTSVVDAEHAVAPRVGDEEGLARIEPQASRPAQANDGHLFDRTSRVDAEDPPVRNEHASPRQLAAYVGLIPSEYSSGAARIEGAWAYRHLAKVSQHIQKRIDALPRQ